ncbi:M23 family metallopeptidase [Candidatus Margulisiibacteriota bacterium]
MQLRRLKENRYTTFLIVPHDSSKGIVNFKLRNWVLYTVLGVFLVSVIFIASSLLYSANLSRRLVHYNTMVQTSEEQKQVISYFTAETNQLKKAMKELVSRDTQLRKLLGLKMKDNNTITAMLKPKKRSTIIADRGAKLRIDKITNELTYVNENIEKQRDSLKSLLRTVKYLRNRFAVTPSIWPIYGRIISGYGYRYYPWRGFHSGIDIVAWYGTPIRTGANGVVTHSGWRGGYGKTVIIDHGYGVKSMYGHCSKLLVGVGSRVVKGQVIAHVGSTGFATGPHVHYEIKKNGYAINPVKYLNLDIFTANKVW